MATFVLSAQPIDDRGAIDHEQSVEFVCASAGDLIEDVAFHEWLEAREPGEAWDLTLEVRA